MATEAHPLRSPKIFKFQLKDQLTQIIEMPRAVKLLTVQKQGGIPCLWAMVWPEDLKERYEITLVGTGWECDVDPGTYLGTVVMDSGLVWHFFGRMV